MTQPDPAMTQTEATEDVVLSDLLVEEVSIDGMCGVY
jgi:mycofactocin precursor